jgi:Ca2+-binding EF-hand superfamily protein
VVVKRGISFLLFFVLLAASSHARLREPATREQLISNLRLILKSWDKDRDGKLSQPEVQAMVDELFRMPARYGMDPRAHPELQAQRQELLEFYARQDANHDGYLTLNELLKEPLAEFDCMDANHDGKLSDQEIFGGMERCSSLTLDQPTFNY